jgi:hypothetical protein
LGNWNDPSRWFDAMTTTKGCRDQLGTPFLSPRKIKN